MRSTLDKYPWQALIAPTRPLQLGTYGLLFQNLNHTDQSLSGDEFLRPCSPSKSFARRNIRNQVCSCSFDKLAAQSTPFPGSKVQDGNQGSKNHWHHCWLFCHLLASLLHHLCNQVHRRLFLLQWIRKAGISGPSARTAFLNFCFQYSSGQQPVFAVPHSICDTEQNTWTHATFLAK